jgi:LuxR family quorum sensing-dependent transcriptional regulator
VIEDFIHNTRQASSTQALFDLYRTDMSKLGFDRIIFSLITDHPEHGHSAGHGIMLNYPDEWMMFYVSQDYELIDPVRRKIYMAEGVFSWQSLHREYSLSKKQAECLHLGNEAGLHDGIGIPLRGPHGELAGIGAASSAGGIEHHPDILSRVGLLSHHFYVCFRRLERKQNTSTSSQLSDREREVLAWYALGMTKQEIGTMLHLSGHTISNHLRKAQHKLGAANMVAAASKAARLGIIEARRVA